ncbi:MAG: AAA family ATPase [Treponema sp.]|nr:AAA family ATPase [Treponema sp.]
MKPLKLELKNFGPYRNEKIDFTALDDMFLITGPTGSGKTFIFDAMTFALFGEANGNRGEKSLKSTFAENEEDASVSFEFSMGGDIYLIYRTLPYDHITKTKNVTHKQSIVDVSKKDKDGNYNPLWNGKKLTEINKNIIDLVGLKAEEFSMVVVLPQGEFAKFIRENSSARTQTLSKLFPVSLYSDIMNSVKDKYDESQAELSGIVNALKQIGENVSFEDLEKNIQKNEEFVKKCSEEIAAAEKNLEEITVKGKELQMKLDEVLKYEANVLKLEKLSAEEPSMKELREKIFGARKALSVYPLYKNMQISSKKIQDLGKSLNDLKSDLKEIEKEESDLLKKKEKTEELKNQLETEKHKFSQLETAWELEGQLKNLSTKKSELEKSIKDNTDQISSLELMVQELENEKKDFELKNISFVVSESLEENKPCPVCGSIHHPCPAEKPAQLLDVDKKIEIQKNSLAIFKERYESEKQKLISWESEIKVKTESFEKTGFSSPLPDLTAESEKVFEMEKEVCDFEKCFNENQNKKSKTEGSLLSAEKNLKIEEASFEQIKADFEKAFSESGFTDENQLKENYIAENLIQDMENEVNAWNEEMSAIKALVSEASVTEKSFVLNEKMNSLRSEYNEKRNENLQRKSEYEEHNNELIKCKQIHSKLSELESTRVKLEEKAEPLKRLYNDLYGNNPKKLKFDSWALGVYFNQVLERASQRFSEISDKRYYFKMKEEISGNGKQGLDFLVCDTYNGTEREVGTLSGGETFMASISLALAMTDFVGGRNCTVQMDSLFIDEGFGTLDAETQDLAMEILTRIGDGNKKIGIISHVENLKQRIPSQLTITKTSSGSHISQ